MNKRNTIRTSEMATISLYVSGQTELNDVTEFFQKNLMNAGEHPVAFFDGVFYESHQERVGNIVFQDYLVYTDKAVYLWARGANKDYLDRFNLGSVSVNSRNKDSDFATLNLKIRREEKEPVYVIFDMVEIQEAELITRLHTVIESAIEDVLGVNYRKEIPDPVAARVLHAARNICPSQPFSISIPEGPAVHQDSSIGYGQDLLEQYKASIGYGQEEQEYPQNQRKQASPAQHVHNPAAEAMRGLENILPADPAALKRIASSIKDMVGDAPFKLRDQVMKDLQHVPGDVATVLTALNELLANIAGNPQAERFVMTAITTAVRNDGVLGSIGKMLKLTTGFGPGGGRKQAPKHASGSDRHSRDDDSGSQDRRPSFDDDDDGSTIRRKKISIKDDSASGGSGMFTGDLPDDEGLPMPGDRNRRATDSDEDAESGIKRKKISIKADDSAASALVRDMMVMDTPPGDEPKVPVQDKQAANDVPSGTEVRRKKIKIVADDAGVPEDALAPKSGSVAENPVQRRKVAVVVDTPGEEVSGITTDELAVALGEATVASGEPEVYSTIESDSKPQVAEGLPAASGNSGSGEASRASGEQPVKRTIKIKSTQ
jgi:hypothetical protein